jgi:hypothetical protein
MPVPSRLTDLSATAASNSPAGSDSIGTSLDDYLRGIQAAARGDLAHKGADIASAATTDLGAIAGSYHDITGTTTVTGLGTVSAGIHKWVKFEGAVPLIHNATSLILPGGANITTADGDTALFYSEGSGNWRCLSYQRAALVQGEGAWELINTYTPSAAASQAITGFNNSIYQDYEIVIDALAPATDAANLFLRTSTDGGSNYDAGASDYAWQTNVGGGTVDNADSELDLTGTGGVGNATDEAVSGTIRIINPGAAKQCRVVWALHATSAVPSDYSVMGGGRRLASADVDAAQLLFSSGNIASGTVRFYGRRR